MPSINGYGNLLNSVWQAWQQGRTQQSQASGGSSATAPPTAPQPVAAVPEQPPVTTPPASMPVETLAPVAAPMPVTATPIVELPVSSASTQIDVDPFLPAPAAAIASPETASLLNLYHQAQAANGPEAPALWVSAGAHEPVGAAPAQADTGRSAAEIMALAAYGMVSDASSQPGDVMSLIRAG